ncbi:hypothetical protein GJ688_15490 [Heliobacillus mobilis]|uniref:Chromosome segregation ATPase n=1 Tax=Heliobacterium mobile TaxID=28064 RepID=A0A6I3SMY6_HELMO|nr:hypothetical protein [Heliobacterium mobile]MTV50373.1 hypothetical protein [Heliobacterium mobile]
MIPMPAIAKIRLTNVQYEQGNKRYTDQTFRFDGHNGAILLENGGGKSVLVQTAAQAVIPNGILADRKLRDTLDVSAAPAHIAVEWILNDKPRQYALTCVTFYMGKEGLEYLLYAYDYPAGDKGQIENLPFVQKDRSGKRPASREEIKEYYQSMSYSHMNAKTFGTKKEYQAYLEETFQIVPSEWEAILKINGAEGGVEKFFEQCATTGQLVDRLLIPVVEQGMAGNGTKDFARLFDNHRQHFREYLELTEQTKEYQDVISRVGQVVERYSRFDREEQAYQSLQGRAKGLLLHVDEELAQSVEAQEELDRKERALQEQEKRLRQKALSLDIARLQRERSEAEERLYRCEQRRDEKQAEHRESASLLESLKLAALLEQLQDKQTDLSAYQRQLEELDHSPDIAHLQSERAQVLSQLRYHFDRLEEDFRQLQDRAQATLSELAQEEQTKKKALLEAEEKRRSLLVLCTETRTHIENKEQQMQKIVQAILHDPLREQVEEQLPHWQKRSIALGEDLNGLIADMRRWQAESEELHRQEKQVQTELTALRQDLTKWETELSTIDKQAQQLIERLHLLSPEDRELNSIYKRQPTIRARLHEARTLLEEEKNQQMEQERILLRFYDLYKDSQLFTADPGLERQCRRWQSDIPSLQLGTAFLQILLEEKPQLTLSRLYEHYPFWPITLICGAADLDKVKKLVEAAAQQWTHPVFILTEQEAQERWTTPFELPAVHVAPGQWPQISEPIPFQAWLEESRQKAAFVVEERKVLEEKLRQWHALADAVDRFWQEYDFQQIYIPLKEKISQGKGRLEELHNAVAQIDGQKQNLQRQLKEGASKKIRWEAEQADVTERYRKGLEWKRLQEERSRLTERLEGLSADEKGVAQKVDELKTQMDDLESKQRQQEKRTWELDEKLKDIRNDVDNKESQNSAPVKAELSLNLLKSRKAELTDKLQGIQQNRKSLQAMISSAEKDVHRLEQQIRRQREQFSDILQGEITFPPNGEEEIERLTERTRSLKRTLDRLNQELSDAQTKATEARTRVAAKEEQFFNTFTDAAIVDFGRQPLEEVEIVLHQESLRLSQEGVQVKGERRRLEKLYAELNSVKKALEVARGVHKFGRESITAISLKEEDLREYPYKRLAFTNELALQLERAQEKVDLERKTVEQERKRFEAYCLQEIKDEKTKQQAVNGIRLKDSFSEIHDWGLRLQERIETAIRIAEESLRSLDEQVQIFINHLHSHLVRICEELKAIPKMTAVKVEEKRKEIFDFTVPHWPELEGKTKLRQHLEWMMKALENEKYRNEQGLEDTAKVQAQIESWLHPKQLLQVVSSSQEIKVRCRKVTNDNRVSSALTDWPTSEKWSGGEKWSKNMTLFLGILNYLAEKRQHIRKGQGNHRVVILDNPFGKASSSHVLGPVFFIAQQLGFQMLALTAHAEGKFLRDYFPIIYSCRLRPTKDPSIAIVEAQKEIRYAYFQDHAPTSLERLEEVEQLTLL